MNELKYYGKDKTFYCWTCDNPIADGTAWKCTSADGKWAVLWHKYCEPPKQATGTAEETLVMSV